MDKLKTKPLYCLQETHFRCEDIYRLKTKGKERQSMQTETKRKLELTGHLYIINRL